MKLVHFAALSIALGLSVSSSDLWAQCNVHDQKRVEQHLNLDLGMIHIDPNAAVGSVILSKSFPVPGQLDSLSCLDGAKISGKIMSGQPSPGQPHIYKTNISGVGLRITHDFGGLRLVYPYTSQSVSASHFSHHTIIVELIKTGERTGTGSLSTGRLSSLYLDEPGSASRPLLTTSISASTNQIVNPSCRIDEGSQSQTVHLGRIRTNQLHGVGDTANEQPFQIKLHCAKDPKGSQRVALAFSYPPVSDLSQQGVLANSIGARYAQGVGVQLLKSQDRSVIMSGAKVEVGTSAAAQHTQPKLDLIARFYKTESEVKAGEFYAAVTFNIDYQ